MTKAKMLTINGRFLSQRPTGVQRYAREIVMELDRLLQQNRFMSSFSVKLVSPAKNYLIPSLGAVGFKQTAGGGPLWDQLILPFATQGVLLSLCNMGPVLVTNQIVCIHDLNTFIAKKSYSRAFGSYCRVMLPLLAQRVARVVTVSNFSARMLCEFGFCKPEKITVIPNGHEHTRRWQASRSPYSINDSKGRPYIFVLGSRTQHKNIGVLFSIADEINALGLDILVAGESGGIFSTFDPGTVAPNVRMLGFVTDDDLAALYQNAWCLVFPSLTEGFGLPALEALAFGCPVIASNTASLPEVCGDAALYADPTSPRDWLNQIKRLRDEPNVVQLLRTKGPRQAERFSWAKCAELYLDLVIALHNFPHRAAPREGF